MPNITWSQTTNSAMLKPSAEGKTKAAAKSVRTKPSEIVPLMEVNGFMIFCWVVKN